MEGSGGTTGAPRPRQLPSPVVATAAAALLWLRHRESNPGLPDPRPKLGVFVRLLPGGVPSVSGGVFGWEGVVGGVEEGGSRV